MMADKERVKVVIAGASGRMGLTIAKEIFESEEMVLAGALDRKHSEFCGKDMGSLSGGANKGIKISDDIGDREFDVLIDFSSPDAVENHLQLCKTRDAAIVIGTTGLNESQNEMISHAAQSIPILYAANTSVGVNLCAALVEMASRALGEPFDIEIVEAHHHFKVDAPSGTALLLGEAAAHGQNLDFPDCGIFTREGQTGPRTPGEIGFSTIRGGDIAGEHTVMFIGHSERIEITHRANDRKIFARGAIRGAKWIAEQEKGLYNMQDVLDLR